MSDSEPAAANRIDRVVALDVDRDTLWRLISTQEGWRDWLVDDAQLVDGAGVVVDSGIVREVRVDHIRGERSVGFTWWEHDDPANVSHVVLEIVDGTDSNGDTDGARLLISEQLLTGATPTPEARLAWEVRVGSLWACTVAMALV
ncbi:MAG: hypothetical protein JWM12_935 [Ilumatobacteraceae bacterium]|nr:hypothetical protein [Ilumatobacteraceae bacterium]